MTRADRLNALRDGFGPSARYVIHTLSDGGRKIVLTNPETDDQVAGSGATLEEALAALEGKVPARGQKGAGQ